MWACMALAKVIIMRGGGIGHALTDYVGLHGTGQGYNYAWGGIGHALTDDVGLHGTGQGSCSGLRFRFRVKGSRLRARARG